MELKKNCKNMCSNNKIKSKKSKCRFICEDINIRTMNINDYEKVNKLWHSIKSLCIRKIDDSKDGVIKFLKRNKTTCVVAVYKKQIVGCILCGHDGREATFYHVCVKENMRNMGIATNMVDYIIEKLNKLDINKIKLVAFKNNKIGNKFWKDIGFIQNKNINFYEKVLNKKNLIHCVRSNNE